MPTNDFVPFATGVGANVLSQADYLASPALSPGQQPGVAASALNNKALRQATFIASCLAQYLANITGNNIIDNGVEATVLATMALTWAAPNPVAFIGTGAQASYTANTPIIAQTILKDTNSAYNGSTGEFVAPATGYYQCNIQVNTNNAGQNNVFVYVDGSSYISIGSNVGGDGNIAGAGIVFATAGQTIDFRYAASWTAVGNSQSSMSIAQIK